MVRPRYWALGKYCGSVLWKIRPQSVTKREDRIEIACLVPGMRQLYFGNGAMDESPRSEFEREALGVSLEPAHDPDTRPVEHVLLVGRVGQLGGKVLAREVKLLVHLGLPLGAVGHVVDEAAIGNVFTCAAFPVVAAQLCDGDKGDSRLGHVRLFTGLWPAGGIPTCLDLCAFSCVRSSSL